MMIFRIILTGIRTMVMIMMTMMINYLLLLLLLLCDANAWRPNRARAYIVGQGS